METYVDWLVPLSRLQRYPKLRFPGYTIRQDDILSYFFRRPGSLLCLLFTIAMKLSVPE
jgi:hypothetical protein